MLDVQNDKLSALEELDEDEFSLISEYSKGLEYLYERYELELGSLREQDVRLEISEEQEYLASQKSVHVLQRMQLHYPKMSRQQLQDMIDWVRKQNDLEKRAEILWRTWRQEYNVRVCV